MGFFAYNLIKELISVIRYLEYKKMIKGMEDNMEYLVVSPDKFDKLLNNKGEIGRYMIIDLRDKQEYEEYHVKDAVNIEYDTFMELNDYGRIIDVNKNIILYCDRGGRSIYAAKKLAMYGYNVKSLAGGINNYLSRYKN